MDDVVKWCLESAEGPAAVARARGLAAKLSIKEMKQRQDGETVQVTILEHVAWMLAWLG